MTDRQDKRDQFETTPNKTSAKRYLPLLVIALVAAAAAGWFLLAPGGGTGSHHLVTAQGDGTLRFPAAEFNDGKARFYRYQGDGGTVDFFLVRSRDGVLRAAYDTCDVCYKERQGYRQEGAEMVCNTCDQRFRTELVNVVKGGCNPVPLQRREINGEVVIAVGDVLKGRGYFGG